MVFLRKIKKINYFLPKALKTSFLKRIHLKHIPFIIFSLYRHFDVEIKELQRKSKSAFFENRVRKNISIFY